MTSFPASTTARYINNFGMVVQLDGSSIIDGEISVEKIQKRRHLDEHEVSGASFDKWLMKLNDDSVNTRSYVCCSVEGFNRSTAIRVLARSKNSHPVGFLL